MTTESISEVTIIKDLGNILIEWESAGKMATHLSDRSRRPLSRQRVRKLIAKAKPVWRNVDAYINNHRCIRKIDTPPYE